MIKINSLISLSDAEIQITFIRAPGPGGQNVNKVATAVQLRFNVLESSLPDEIRARLFKLIKTTQTGEIIIKASRFRTQERNKQDAINRLRDLIQRAAIQPKKRKKTRPTKGSVERRLSGKKIRSKVKSLRQSRV